MGIHACYTDIKSVKFTNEEINKLISLLPEKLIFNEKEYELNINGTFYSFNMTQSYHALSYYTYNEVDDPLNIGMKRKKPEQLEYFNIQDDLREIMIKVNMLLQAR